MNLIREMRDSLVSHHLTRKKFRRIIGESGKNAKDFIHLPFSFFSILFLHVLYTKNILFSSIKYDFLNMKILIIEDNRILAKNIREYLTLKAFQAEVAFDGIMGKEKANSEHFDVIVLDINLPGKDGLTLCQELREV